MPRKIQPNALAWMLGMAMAITVSSSSRAAPYELRIYDDDIPEPNAAEIELIMSVAKPNVTKDNLHGRVVQTLLEYGYGLGKGWAAGLELPVSRVQGRDKLEGVKLELQYVAEHDATQGVYWGVRGDLGYASSPYELQGGNSMGINPILGFRHASWHLVVNPSIEMPLSGPQTKTQFLPSAKISRRLSDTSQLGIEYFSGWGALSAVLPRRERDESLYLVWDEQLSASHLNLGLGKPLHVNGASADKWVVKVGWNVGVD